MKWIVLVLFATSPSNIFVFHSPEFSSKEECKAALTINENLRQMAIVVSREYGKFMPIEKIECVEKDKLNNIIKGNII